MPNVPRRLPLLPLMLACQALPVAATPPLTVPGSLVYSCAGHANGDAYLGIAQETSFYAGQYQCREQFDPLGGKLSAKAGYTGPQGGNASSKGQAKWGSLKAQDASHTLGGEAGRSIAVFNDRWTLSSDSQNGSYGYVTVALRTTGHIEAHGASGAAALVAQLYRDGNPAGSWAWAVETDLYQPDANLDVDEIRELAIPVNFGTSFVVSTVLIAQSGARSQEGVGHGITAATHPGLVWHGIVKVTDRFNNVLTDWQLSSASGIDWRLPCPCPPP